MEKYNLEDINRMGDMKIKEIVNSVVYNLNYDVVTVMFERVFEGMNEEEFKEMFFSNMKTKVVEELARQEGISEPSSKEAWNKIIEKYSLEKIKNFIDKVAEYEFRKFKPKIDEHSY